MAAPQGRVRSLAEYAAARCAATFFRILPLSLATRFSRVIADIWLYFDPRHRQRIIEAGMEKLGMSREEAEQLARDNYRHYTSLLVEFSHLHAMTPDEAEARIQPHTMAEQVEECLSHGKGLVILTGHLGNWEWATTVKSVHHSHTKGFIARPLNNPYIDRMVCNIRERNGTQVWYKAGSIRKALAALKQGEAFAAVVDQSAGHHGTVVPFMGYPASTMSVPVELAIRVGSPVVVACLLRDKEPLRFKIERGAFHYPTPGADPEQEKLRLLGLVNADFERIIRQYPEQWIWIHRRWKLHPDQLEAWRRDHPDSGRTAVPATANRSGAG